MLIIAIRPLAEIGACLLLNELNIPTPDMCNTASYIQHWLRGLQNDSRFIFSASSQANKAVDYVLSFSKTAAESREPAIVI